MNKDGLVSAEAPIRHSADLSPCRTWRYTLERIWDDDKPRLLFVLLNPSTADESEDDPTLRRGMGFARRWGYGHLVFVNLFAFRATDPTDLRKVADPIGPHNDHFIQIEADRTDCIICAWGAHGGYLHRDRAMLDILPKSTPKPLYTLGMTKGGHPKHPLYLAKNTKLEAWCP